MFRKIHACIPANHTDCGTSSQRHETRLNEGFCGGIGAGFEVWTMDFCHTVTVGSPQDTPGNAAVAPLCYATR